MHSDVLICYTEAFEGPRHDRCYEAWDQVEAGSDATIERFANGGAAKTHDVMFSQMWEYARTKGFRYVMLTEADFLPDLTHDWIGYLKDRTTRPASGTDDWARESAMVGCSYPVRDQNHWALTQTQMSGGWFQFFDLEQFNGPLDFSAGADPGTEVPSQVGEDRCLLYEGTPELLSITYPWGCHLFWSRHYSDVPMKVINHSAEGVEVQLKTVDGFQIWFVQECFDRLMLRWETIGRV